MRITDVSNRESHIAATAGCGTGEILQLARNAFEVAWLSTVARATYLAEFDDYATSQGVMIAR